MEMLIDVWTFLCLLPKKEFPFMLFLYSENAFLSVGRQIGGSLCLFLCFSGNKT